MYGQDDEPRPGQRLGDDPVSVGPADGDGALGGAQAPAWIRAAIDGQWAGNDVDDRDAAEFARELLDQLPIERMLARATEAVSKVRQVTDERIAGVALASMVAVLSEPDLDVSTFVDLYVDACHALQVAGVPHAFDGGLVMTLGSRIRWLAMQRPSQEIQTLKDRILGLETSKASLEQQLAQLPGAAPADRSGLNEREMSEVLDGSALQNGMLAWYAVRAVEELSALRAGRR